MADYQARINIDWGAATRINKYVVRIAYRIRVFDVEPATPVLHIDVTRTNDFHVRSFSDLQSQIEAKTVDEWMDFIKKDPANPAEWPIPADLPTQFDMNLPEPPPEDDPLAVGD